MEIKKIVQMFALSASTIALGSPVYYVSKAQLQDPAGYTAAVQGLYIVTEDASVTHQILISAPNVVFDLNGKTITDIAGIRPVIEVSANNSVVKNGTIIGQGFTTGLSVDGQTVVSDIVFFNGFRGMQTGFSGGSSRFERCSAYNCSEGFWNDSIGLEIQDCTAVSCGFAGFHNAFFNASLKGCTAKFCSNGILFDNGTYGTVTDCEAIFGTTGISFGTGTSATVTNCELNFNSADGLDVSDTSTVLVYNSVANGNGGVGFNSMIVTGKSVFSHSKAESNTSWGFKALSGTNAQLRGNVASLNGGVGGSAGSDNNYDWDTVGGFVPVTNGLQLATSLDHVVDNISIN